MYFNFCSDILWPRCWLLMSIIATAITIIVKIIAFIAAAAATMCSRHRCSFREIMCGERKMSPTNRMLIKINKWPTPAHDIGKQFYTWRRTENKNSDALHQIPTKTRTQMKFKYSPEQSTSEREETAENAGNRMGLAQKPCNAYMCARVDRRSHAQTSYGRERVQELRRRRLYSSLAFSYINDDDKWMGLVRAVSNKSSTQNTNKRISICK